MKYRKGESGDLRGMYETSFFEMYVAIDDENIDIARLSPDSLDTFFHEYIHFLQDISTFLGLEGLYCYSEYVNAAINAVKGVDCINLPIAVPFSKNNVALNRWLYGQIFRNGEAEDLLLIGRVKRRTIDVPARYQKRIRSLFVYDIQVESNFVPFGALAIAESMAYLAEKICLPETYVTSPQYPYESAYFVASKYSVDIANDNLKLFALCDCALLYANPAQFFVETLEKVKEGKLKIINAEDFYTYLYQIKLPNGQLFRDSFEKHLGMVRKCVHDYLIDLPEAKKAVFIKYNQCVDAYFDMARELRLERPTMLLDMMKEESVLKNRVFNYIYQKIGTPLLRTNGGYSNYSPHKEQDEIGVEWFKAIKQVMDALYKGTSICELCDWCPTMDEQCMQRPWDHTEPDGYLCMYNFIWKHWGLRRHTIGHVTYREA